MPSLTEIIKLPLAHRKGEFIRVSHVEKPHGEHSDPMIQIAVSYKGDENASMLEIPYENLDAFVEALHESKKVCSTFYHERSHSELSANTGGGQ